MSVLTPEPRTTQPSLDEQIDHAKQMIMDSDFGGGVDHLEQICRQALREEDADALKRIAVIARNSRDLSGRYHGRFERLLLAASGKGAVPERGKRGGMRPLAYGLVAGHSLFLLLLAAVSWDETYYERDEAWVFALIAGAIVTAALGLLGSRKPRFAGIALIVIGWGWLGFFKYIGVYWWAGYGLLIALIFPVALWLAGLIFLYAWWTD